MIAIRVVHAICSTVIFCVGVSTVASKESSNAGVTAMIVGGFLIFLTWFSPMPEKPDDPTDPPKSPDRGAS